MFWIENSILAQICGFMGMFITLVAYLQKDDFSVKKMMVISVFFWGAHFFLLWVFSWFAATVIWFIRLALSVKYKKNKTALFFVLSLSLISAYFTFTSLYSLLPVIASMCWAYAYFYLEKIKLRLVMVLNSSLWLLYNAMIGSVSWVINEVVVQIVLIATLYRMAHPEWGMRYYSQKIADILLQRSKPDYDRYIFIRDKVASYRKLLWQHFLMILHYDLKQFFQKKRKISWKLLWSK